MTHDDIYKFILHMSDTMPEISINKMGGIYNVIKDKNKLEDLMT